jgi:hypothetical protein
LEFNENNEALAQLPTLKNKPRLLPVALIDVFGILIGCFYDHCSQHVLKN